RPARVRAGSSGRPSTVSVRRPRGAAQSNRGSDGGLVGGGGSVGPPWSGACPGQWDHALSVPERSAGGALGTGRVARRREPPGHQVSEGRFAAGPSGSGVWALDRYISSTVRLMK